MKVKIPTVVIAGTNSGCGKTTITCALMKALKEKGLSVNGFKCGPDYIDTMFHSRVLGKKSRNLDTYFFDDKTLKYLYQKNAAGADICIIEGVMGYYDGLISGGIKASTYDVASKLFAPAILIVDVIKNEDVKAVIKDMLSKDDRNTIKGVILNRCERNEYDAIKKEIENEYRNLSVVGMLSEDKSSVISSRHLGLMTADEIEDIDDKLDKLGEMAKQNIDLCKIEEIAKSVSEIEVEDIDVPSFSKVKIAVARDKAFCFYYEDSLELLKEMGAEIVYFSPLEDNKIPKCDGLILGGGYPEVYKEKLSKNLRMRESVKKAVESHLPTIAECGGFMYLTDKIDECDMAGVIHTSCKNEGHLTRFGYMELTAKKDSMLAKRGDTIRSHEFHYWDCNLPGENFHAKKLSGKEWDCVFATDTLFAGYPHLHFYANKDFAVNFIKACLKYKEDQNDRDY